MKVKIFLSLLLASLITVIEDRTRPEGKDVSEDLKNLHSNSSLKTYSR